MKAQGAPPHPDAAQATRGAQEAPRRRLIGPTRGHCALDRLLLTCFRSQAEAAQGRGRGDAEEAGAGALGDHAEG